MKITKNSIRLYASSKGVITSFLFLPGKHRISNVIKRLESLKEEEIESCLEKVMKDFAHRHRDIEKIFLNHFNRINNQYKDDLLLFSSKKRILLGAFFTKEYSIQAAALFNPSIVPHPDQTGLQPEEQRFIMSLRATGEGHISSIVFKTGVVDDDANITLDADSGSFTSLEKNEAAEYTKSFIKKRAATLPDFKTELLDLLPDNFTAAQAIHIFNENELSQNEFMSGSCNQFREMLDMNYELEESSHLPINEKVIFPNAKGESMGMEDVRFVQFKDGENSCYYGSYTAYDGHNIKSQLIETKDFIVFKIRTLYGSAVSDKGMALFPEKVGGKYVMISRQGGETINIMFSDDLYFWNSFKILMEPRYIWEIVQLGNCGSPVKTDKGWLLLTHGMGAMRTYVISAILLDLNDPSIIVGRLNKPIIEADESEREGYTPNVVYTCGLMRHKDLLIIPYAVSDSATGFVTIKLQELLNEFNTSN
ncbi:MAG: glycoside hydrolase family 130 protein [Chitinophagaceae bacterium]